MNKIGEDIFPYYMEVRRADVLAQSEYRRAEKLKNLDEVEQTYAEIIEKRAVCIVKRISCDRQRSDPGRNEAGKRDRGKVKRIIEPCDRESGNEYERDPVELYFHG